MTKKYRVYIRKDNNWRLVCNTTEIHKFYQASYKFKNWGYEIKRHVSIIKILKKYKCSNCGSEMKELRKPVRCLDCRKINTIKEIA